MIINNTSQVTSLDTVQLRRIADGIRAGEGWDALAEEIQCSNGAELMVETCRSLGLEWLETDDIQIAPEAIEGFPLKLIHRFEIFPLERDGHVLKLAVTNPFDFNAVDTVSTS
ncbi:MAG: hypothetical protein VX034_12720, partial [Planctomycetota bacterium]|nr:hypothetical protein [Planctomycetota bacterium]